MGSITYHVLENLSFTASAAYAHYRIEQDIEYHDTVGTPFVDRDVPYRNEAQNYSLDAQYTPHDRITLAGGFDHTIGRSSFSPNASALLAPQSIASFSKMKTTGTGYNASCQLDLPRGFSSRLRYRHTKFDDELGNPYDDAFDGRAHIVSLALSKEW
jgi:long-subunit fatty acid transport protein